MYALYSEEQAEMIGTFIYLRSDGTRVECTSVSKNPNSFAESVFKDKIDKGEVVKFVSSHDYKKKFKDVFIKKHPKHPYQEIDTKDLFVSISDAIQ